MLVCRFSYSLGDRFPCSKEDVIEGWIPSAEIFVHRVPNEMRAFSNEMNVNHDLVISDPSIKG
jgi:hypothetical protein